MKTHKAKGEREPLRFVDVGVSNDGQGHYLLNPACVNGYFKPGDKVQVTVKPYASEEAGRQG